jgi:uncharacterized membrane protein YccC
MGWYLIDGAAGLALGCLVSLVILLIRASGRPALMAWRMGEAEQGKTPAEPGKETEKTAA